MSIPSTNPSRHDAADVLAVDVDEAARRAGVGRGTIYKAIGAGDLTAKKLGRRTVIRVQDLAAWLARLPTMPVRDALESTGATR